MSLPLRQYYTSMSLSSHCVIAYGQFTRSLCTASLVALQLPTQTQAKKAAVDGACRRHDDTLANSLLLKEKSCEVRQTKCSSGLSDFEMLQVTLMSTKFTRYLRLELRNLLSGTFDNPILCRRRVHKTLSHLPLAHPLLQVRSSLPPLKA